MAKDSEHLQEKILELEARLQEKSSLVLIYKEEIQRMNAQIEKLIGRIQQELRVGNKIHEMLLPTAIPTIPGFEFSTKFKASAISGGDYFEIIPHEDKFRFGILLSSSSGYSMSALFLTVLLKLTGEIATRKGLSPADFLKKTWQDLEPQMALEDTASIFYGIVDRRKYELQYCACGNVFAGLYSNSEDTVDVLEISYAQMQKTSKVETFKNKSVKLHPKDRLLIASEGFIEESNEAGEIFGKDNLKKIFLKNKKMSTHELRNEYFVEIEKHRKTAKASRDLTLLLLDIKENVIKLASE